MPEKRAAQELAIMPVSKKSKGEMVSSMLLKAMLLYNSKCSFVCLKATFKGKHGFLDM